MSSNMVVSFPSIVITLVSSIEMKEMTVRPERERKRRERDTHTETQRETHRESERH